MTWRAPGTAPTIPLIAVAHGSRDPRAAATVESLLDLLRRARPEIPVRTAYLDHAPPTLGMALSGLAEAVVLPLLLTEAYHSRVDIPGALAEATARRPLLRVHRGATLGPHPLLVTALERRLAEAGVEAGDPGTAVVLVSAGSSDRRANATIARIAREWAGLRGWWSVTTAYASAAEPTPEQEVRRLVEAGAPRVVVAPYLLAPGYFADKIRATTLAAGAEVVADVLGAAPELATVLLERYEQAVQREKNFATA
ncbi:Sirohydrochlorin ferrochelatase [Streptosporangium subroseum]|uniref:Sirohydrochlorin ferrochelatase n=1 Tax=Streptosporangium subroseum TaxID=106412 RepID=A0A239CBT5_9ACTN|nr:sirohydrochlorin chelatase [Streptosporangium subroseum]SNS17685.1 Sirohydrochlorin ferrochelatase [Streptosporangium subroseum]